MRTRSNVSRLLQAQDEQTHGPFRNPERHTTGQHHRFRVKQMHMVVIKALYPHGACRRPWAPCRRRQDRAARRQVANATFFRGSRSGGVPEQRGVARLHRGSDLFRWEAASNRFPTGFAPSASDPRTFGADGSSKRRLRQALVGSADQSLRIVRFWPLSSAANPNRAPGLQQTSNHRLLGASDRRASLQRLTEGAE